MIQQLSGSISDRRMVGLDDHVSPFQACVSIISIILFFFFFPSKNGLYFLSCSQWKLHQTARISQICWMAYQCHSAVPSGAPDIPYQVPWIFALLDSLAGLSSSILLQCFILPVSASLCIHAGLLVALPDSFFGINFYIYTLSLYCKPSYCIHHYS